MSSFGLCNRHMIKGIPTFIGANVVRQSSVGVATRKPWKVSKIFHQSRFFRPSTPATVSILGKNSMAQSQSNPNGTTTVTSSLSHLLKRNESFAINRDAAQLTKHAEGQTPSVFWLGCSDSRVPESLIIGADLGEVFVHRNVANVFNPSDTSATAALAYAVNNLKVTHVVVVGHECCGGCAAALASASSTNPSSDKAPEDIGTAAIVRWIEPICQLAKLKLEQDPKTTLSDLVKENVRAQVNNLVNHEVVQKAWERGQPLTIHGWVFDIAQGKLTDQGLCKSCP